VKNNWALTELLSTVNLQMRLSWSRFKTYTHQQWVWALI